MTESVRVGLVSDSAQGAPSDLLSEQDPAQDPMNARESDAFA
jgi:hypothetical protein